VQGRRRLPIASADSPWQLIVGPVSSVAMHGGKGRARGWGTGTAGRAGRGVAGGGVDRRSDRVRGKRLGKRVGVRSVVIYSSVFVACRFKLQNKDQINNR
jgi:hypothetical protein